MGLEQEKKEEFQTEKWLVVTIIIFALAFAIAMYKHTIVVDEYNLLVDKYNVLSEECAASVLSAEYYDESDSDLWSQIVEDVEVESGGGKDSFYN